MKGSLEDIVKREHKKPNLWDSLVSAYSSGKAVKLGILSAEAGLHYIPLVAASGMFYLASKTIGLAVKNIVKLSAHPIKYLRNIKEQYYDAKEFYRPFGRYKNPTILGATLTAITQYTGF